ncbi:MAG: hypothetical protein BAJALOKI2v1_430008 [Promethearchaeota archaeon]|nr:MAG: hypothetical protein BAJALOKI2v1_430008 [Candidatus Lokiarchaeota archaeon]
MDQAGFDKIVEDLNEYDGIDKVFLLDKDGKILFKSRDFQLSDEEGKEILKSWKEKESAIMFQGDRYAILKNDEIQLAAKNIVGQKGNLAGSVTKEGDYLIAHVINDTGMILLEWSIFVNKVAWK